MWRRYFALSGQTDKAGFSKCHKGVIKSHGRGELHSLERIIACNQVRFKKPRKGIVLRPERNQAKISLKLVVDAEFTGNKDTRKSIMGRVIYLNKTPIGWNSKGQESITLSSTEAEYVSNVYRDVSNVHQDESQPTNGSFD